MDLKITIDENGEIDIKQFSDIIDISLIEYYSFEKEHGNLILKFFDKNKNILTLNKGTSLEILQTEK